MRIYLDHNATTPIHPEVLKKQMEVSQSAWGNASSLHEEGRVARHALETARKQVAELIGARPEEIIFTSGGTEGNNLALFGVCEQIERQGLPKGQIISSPVEHPSVKASLAQLAQMGWKIQMLQVDRYGRLDLNELERTLRKNTTSLITLAMCNHELGNLYPLEDITRLGHQYGAFVHSDAVQAVGRISVDVSQLPVDLMTLSAHKLYGPKGVGALFCRALRVGDPIAPRLLGGQQEKGRRAGTENVPAIAGFGTACMLAKQEREGRIERTRSLRERLENQLKKIPGFRLHGDPEYRAPGTCNVGFEGVEGEAIMMSLDLNGVAVSTGSACSSGSPEPSPVLRSLGLSKEQALQGVRFSLGYGNTEAEVDQAVTYVKEIVARVCLQG